jgi:hypothetical protein
LIIKDIKSAVPRSNFLKMIIHIYLLPLHVSALVGHLQEEYTIARSGTSNNLDNTRNRMQNPRIKIDYVQVNSGSLQQLRLAQFLALRIEQTPTYSVTTL